MRVTATAVGVIVAAVVSSGVTSSAIAPSSTSAARAAAPAAVCQTHLGTFDHGGTYREVNVSSDLTTIARRQQLSLRHHPTWSVIK